MRLTLLIAAFFADFSLIASFPTSLLGTLKDNLDQRRGPCPPLWSEQSKSGRCYGMFEGGSEATCTRNNGTIANMELPKHGDTEEEFFFIKRFFNRSVCTRLNSKCQSVRLGYKQDQWDKSLMLHSGGLALNSKDILITNFNFLQDGHSDMLFSCMGLRICCQNRRLISLGTFTQYTCLDGHPTSGILCMQDHPPPTLPPPSARIKPLYNTKVRRHNEQTEEQEGSGLLSSLRGSIFIIVIAAVSVGLLGSVALVCVAVYKHRRSTTATKPDANRGRQPSPVEPVELRLKLFDQEIQRESETFKSWNDMDEELCVRRS